MAKKIVEKLKIQFREETRLKNRNLSETKADIHVVSKKIENKKSLTYSLYQVLCRMRYMTCNLHNIQSLALHAHRIFLRFSSFHKIYFPHRRQHRYKHPITSTLNKLCVFNAFSAHQQDWQIWKALKTDQGRREKQGSYHTLQAIL